jgi:hypothetical protein
MIWFTRAYGWPKVLSRTITRHKKLDSRPSSLRRVRITDVDRVTEATHPERVLLAREYHSVGQKELPGPSMAMAWWGAADGAIGKASGQGVLRLLIWRVHRLSALRDSNAFSVTQGVAFIKTRRGPVKSRSGFRDWFM